jgi:hypothetical protein
MGGVDCNWGADVLKKVIILKDCNKYHIEKEWISLAQRPKGHYGMPIKYQP